MEHPWKLYLDPHLDPSNPPDTTTFATVAQMEGYIRRPGKSDVQRIEHEGTTFWIREEGLDPLLQRIAKFSNSL